MNVRGLNVSILCMIASVLVSGCATSPPSRFYVISALEEARVCQKYPDITIGISPIDLPRYLDRPQIMTRINENEIQLSELDLWAEPLKDNIPRVLGQNLTGLLCTDVDIFPWRGSEKISYRITVSVLRLDGSLTGGEAVLDARWIIVDEQTKKVLVRRESRFAEPLRSQDYPSMVSAYSRLLASFSREIANAVPRE
jgi:uncharacterized protein